MAITAPPTITALPAAPDPNDRSTFNSRAYPWAAAQAVMVTETNAVAANVYSNASQAETLVNAAMAAGLEDAAANATTATEKAAIATAKAAEAIAAVAGVDFTADSVTTFTNKTLEKATFTDGYTESVATLSGTTPAISADNGSIQTWALTANSAPTDALQSGQSVTLVITPGAYIITAWPSVIWLKPLGGGSAPNLFSAGKTMVLLCKVGSTLFGTHMGDA